MSYNEPVVSSSLLSSPANVLSILIMKKETFAIHLENEMARDQLMKDMLDCIEFAAGGEWRRMPIH